jgi:hypothetical protein
MTFSLLALWALVGWCGTPWPRWWRWPIPPPPEPDPRGPSPQPWLVSKIIGVVGGIAGGWVYAEVFGPLPDPWNPGPEPWMRGLAVAATALGAFVGARLLSDIYELARGGGRAARG